MRWVVMTLLLVVSLVINADENTTEQGIKQRIQPVGKVHVQEESVKASTPKETQGQKIYERYCMACHRDGLVGAPKIQDEQSWKSRLSDKTLEDLVSSATKGLNAMPAKGTCYECNEDDIKSAIEYMLPNHE